ncbi:MAG: TfoX/Sxy family protein, partial [Rhodothermales bacterium]|nr:TfoX/Sxy family protein [Rhodothermales bacterium]
MPFDETLASRVRHLLTDVPGVLEKRMFGGLAFMVHGHMCCGIVGEDLMLRVGAERYEQTLGHDAARPMDFTGRPMK